MNWPKFILYLAVLTLLLTLGLAAMLDNFWEGLDWGIFDAPITFLSTIYDAIFQAFDTALVQFSHVAGLMYLLIGSLIVGKIVRAILKDE